MHNINISAICSRSIFILFWSSFFSTMFSLQTILIILYLCSPTLPTLQKIQMKQTLQNPAMEPGAKKSLASSHPNCLLRAVKLFAYLLTCFPPSNDFVPHCAYWVRQEPQKSLGAHLNLPGLLARIMHEGSIQVAKIPRREHWEASGQITYTSHWIGKTWNGDGLEAIVDPRLRLGSCENVVYSSRNGGSWLVLQRKRRPSMDGAHEAIAADWTGGKDKSTKSRRAAPAVPSRRKGGGESKSRR